MQKNIIPKVAAIHDLSGLGRCSLAVALPILSVMGIQACPVPTAILSTQTGGFEKFSFVDFTDEMNKYIAHWKTLDIEFDAIYSGFLGSVRQIDIVTDFIKYFKKDNTLVVIDPVFGDNGRIYQTFGEDIVDKMRGFIRNADVITPNITEAAYLLGEPVPETMERETVKLWLKRLSDMGPCQVVITSVPEPLSENMVIAAAYNKQDNKCWQVSCEYTPKEYPGTGDVFASVLVGGLINGASLPEATEQGVKFVSEAIAMTFKNKTSARYGIAFEKNLHKLAQAVEQYGYENL